MKVGIKAATAPRTAKPKVALAKPGLARGRLKPWIVTRLRKAMMKKTVNIHPKVTP